MVEGAFGDFAIFFIVCGFGGECRGDQILAVCDAERDAPVEPFA